MLVNWEKDNYLTKVVKTVETMLIFFRKGNIMKTTKKLNLQELQTVIGGSVSEANANPLQEALRGIPCYKLTGPPGPQSLREDFQFGPPGSQLQ